MYTGRFAPTPSGPLHFGSLVTALASFLDARAHQGQWLLRIEDIDELRTVKGADSLIMKTLEHHGLLWDGEVVYQSLRKDYYQHVVDTLFRQGAAYYCECTRKQIQLTGGIYTGTCRHKQLKATNNAIRFIIAQPNVSFNDAILGQVRCDEEHAFEDPIIKRRDGYFAYNLVVVADDIQQEVTHIVRGSDLLTTTPAHLSLYQQLSHPPPEYAHVPVAATSAGIKLSKQNRATAIDNTQAPLNICNALRFLGLTPSSDINCNNLVELLAWATLNWHYDKIPNQQEIIVDSTYSTYHNGQGS
jgi:glutamyl-Q tRNA(Asp) synthetase